MALFPSGNTTLRRASLGLVVALVALASAFAPLAGSAQAATTTKVYAGSVNLGGDTAFVGSFAAGDIVTGTVTIEMDPIPPSAWAWFTVISAPGMTPQSGNGTTVLQFSFTATASGQLRIGAIGTGTAYYLFSVKHTTLQTVPRSPIGGVTRN